MKGKRIQLWSNDNLSEFAIIFESKILARTNVKATYVKLVDELIVRNWYDSDWRYTLSQWVVFYLSHKYSSDFRSDKTRKQEVNGVKSKNYQNLKYEFILALPAKSKRTPRPTIKCTFCNLKYHKDEQRKQHEEFWHKNKTNKYDKPS
jgi:hypothetical protein